MKKMNLFVGGVIEKQSMVGYGDINLIIAKVDGKFMPLLQEGYSDLYYGVSEEDAMEMMFYYNSYDDNAREKFDEMKKDRLSKATTVYKLTEKATEEVKVTDEDLTTL
jgi:hypothetical protein